MAAYYEMQSAKGHQVDWAGLFESRLTLIYD